MSTSSIYSPNIIHSKHTIDSSYIYVEKENEKKEKKNSTQIHNKISSISSKHNAYQLSTTHQAKYIFLFNFIVSPLAILPDLIYTSIPNIIQLIDSQCWFMQESSIRLFVSRFVWIDEFNQQKYIMETITLDIFI